MSPAPAPDALVREELSRAFGELRPQMIAFARQDADLDPKSRVGEFGDEDIEQFLNAWEALFREALDGQGREKRDLILETALPPVMELGQTALDIARSNTISAVMTTHRLLARVAGEHRDEAARWLARFFSDYGREVVGRALALEQERR
jgi:hypothetical protein